MGEHTIREILKRRSPETQRAMKRRRELAGLVEGRGGRLWTGFLIVVAVVVLGAGYLVYMGHEVGARFGDAKALRSGKPDTLTLSRVTEFLPNTLLATADPAFYSSGGFSGTELTRRVVHVYYPGAFELTTRAMALALESGYTKSDILEAFINDAPMGGDPAHPVKGFAAASKYYFAKPFAQLSPQDIALLVAVAAHPGLDPRQDPAKALQERNLVLQSDQLQNVLAEAVVTGLTKLPLDVTPQPGG